jgi:hypothetical protein
MSLTPILTSTPGAPVTYNPNIAETFSWIPIEGAGRPLYSKASYLVNTAEITDVIYELINVLRQKENDNGFDFVDDTDVHSDNYQTLKVIADCKIVGLTADNSSVGNLSAYELPQGFELNGQIYNFQLAYGAVLAYKTVDPYRFTNSLIGTNGQSLVTTLGHSIVTIQG